MRSTKTLSFPGSRRPPAVRWQAPPAGSSSSCSERASAAPRHSGDAQLRLLLDNHDLLTVLLDGPPVGRPRAAAWWRDPRVHEAERWPGAPPGTTALITWRTGHRA